MKSYTRIQEKNSIYLRNVIRKPTFMRKGSAINEEGYESDDIVLSVTDNENLFMTTDK